MRRRPRSSPRAGFSMLELVIVLAVTVLLTSMLFPAISHVRENLNRVMCASNARQFGLGTMMFAKDNKDKLMSSFALSSPERVLRLKQLRSARIEGQGWDGGSGWDGLGQLYARGYCDAPECFYCPSHAGETVLEREKWESRRSTSIHTHYHYSGEVHWTDLDRRRRLSEGYALVLAVDALPVNGEININHGGVGMNTLRGDGSVLWHEQTSDEVTRLTASSQTEHRGVWRELERLLQ